MPLSLYSATVPHFLQILPQIVILLDKAEAHCAAKGLPPEALLGARLAEDMFPLSWQFRFCWSHSADAVDGLLSGERRPEMSEVPNDFAYLRERLGGAIARLKAVNPADVDAAEDNLVIYKVRDLTLEMTGTKSLLLFSLHNFMFHATTVYAILRNQGVEIGKRDFLGALPVEREYFGAAPYTQLR